ncbi:MAG: hypothetical protein GQ522_00045 [Deltaproteobacteria bacterium]|nr:hypothetical protein [Deltaproteobacteria bacterium]
MLDASGFAVPQYTSRQHSLIGKRPDIKRVNAWERELTPREIEIFESITGDLLHYLGYVPRYGLKAKGVTEREKLALMIREASHYIVHRIRLHSRMGSMK